MLCRCMNLCMLVPERLGDEGNLTIKMQRQLRMVAQPLLDYGTVVICGLRFVACDASSRMTWEYK